VSRASPGRREDGRLVTGAGRFTGDLGSPEDLHVHFLRADRAHARIARIDAHGARGAPGVVAVFTGADLAPHQRGSFPARMPLEGRNGATLHHARRPVLAMDRVRYVGEPVAMIVARSVAEAQDAAERVAIDYADLPHVVDAVAALEPAAPAVWPDKPDNVCFDWEIGDADAARAAFAEAAHVTTVTMRNERLYACPLEPLVCIARHDADARVTTLQCPTQGAAQMQAQVGAVTGLTAKELVVLTSDVGGAFGVKAHAVAEHPAMVIAARLLPGRRLRWTASRSESMLAEHHGRDSVVTARVAMDRGGRFLAMDFAFVCNAGAYPTANGQLIMTKNPAQGMAGVYRTPIIHARVTCVFTNTSPVGPYRGAGRPEMAYAIERLVDAAAAETGIDPVELRRRNLIAAADMPYGTPTGSTYDSGDFAAVLDRAIAAADRNGFEARRARSARGGRLRGLGVGLFLEGTGASPHESVRLALDERGAVTAECGTQSTGQGHETVFAHLAAARLGIDARRVIVNEGDASSAALGGPSVASRSLHAAGSALVLACDALVHAGKPRAAQMLDADMGEIEFADGHYRCGDRAVALEAIARERHALGEPALSVAHRIDVAPTFPNGCHVAEVEVDPETGDIAVCRYTCVDDFGVVADHAIVEGQLQGALAQAVGEVLSEAVRYDAASGQLVNGTLMDYAVPVAAAVPGADSSFHAVPCTTNALGAKGAGEAGTTGGVCALMNAIHDAVRPAGVTHLDKPVTTERLWRALRGA